MNISKLLGLCVILAVVVSLAGCGVSKDKYGALLNEKVALEEKLAVANKAKDALKNEYDNLLKEKMNLASEVTTVKNEKTALKGEYDKILDEKVALKAAYDRLLAESTGA